MKLNGTLQNCLMAVGSRYPQYIVDIDVDIWGDQCAKLNAETALELLEQLQASASELLHTSALVECDTYRCELRVVDLSEERPALLFHFPRVLATSP